MRARAAAWIPRVRMRSGMRVSGSAFAKSMLSYCGKGDPYYNPHFTLKYENYGYK